MRLRTAEFENGQGFALKAARKIFCFIALADFAVENGCFALFRNISEVAFVPVMFHYPPMFQFSSDRGKRMTAQLTFFPLGNADTTLIQLANDQLLLMDYASVGNPDDAQDKRCDLRRELNDALDEVDQESFRAVAFSHLDDDHVCGASDYFWFDHAEKYQGDGRPKINELWVPAGAITEEGLDDHARVIRQEARHRLKKGYGIRVFSRPKQLEDFLAANDLSVEDRQEFIVDAGNLVPGFSVSGEEKAEFFVHCPFAWRTDDGLVDRNENSVVLQMTAVEGGNETYLLLGSDVNHETLSEIVRTTRRHENEHRLQWDVLKLFHHCSYKSLGPDRGTEKTEPIEDVKWLFEELARENEIIVSTSKPIPAKDTAEDEDKQPPHRQAANYYRGIVRDSNGKFEVTMESPNRSQPKPLRLKITAAGAAVMLSAAATATAAATGQTTRAG